MKLSTIPLLPKVIKNPMTRTKTERYRPTFISRSHPDKGFEVSTGDKKSTGTAP
jgi:hypothetical protein